MISSAIKNFMIMIIIILIIHFLLKHVLFEQSVNNPLYEIKDNGQTEKKQFNSEQNIHENDKEQKPKLNTKELDSPSQEKMLETFINEGRYSGDDNPLSKVKIQPPRPWVDRSMLISMKEDDVNSFILGGEQNPYQNQNQSQNQNEVFNKNNLAGSFFSEPHIPQDISNPNLIKPISVKGGGTSINPYTDMDPYKSRPYYENNSSIFKGVIPANETETDSDSMSLNEVFKIR
jgi:hypothetical protein